MWDHKIDYWVMLIVLCSAISAEGQSYQVIKPGDRTKRQITADNQKGNVSISVELLMPRQQIGLAAQQWAKTFSKLGVTCRVRQPILDDEPKIKETKRGKLRMVTLIGLLDRKGNVLFPGKSFNQQEVDKLSDWLREIRSYGAQGAPNGQPVWGLSKKQFDPLFKAMSQKVSEELFAVPISKAILKLAIPKEYPVRLTAKSKAKLTQVLIKDPPVRQQLKGISKGTALAILLNDYKIGFRPLRTPEGNIELAIVALADESDVWPIGWETKTSFTKIARKLYQLIPVELKEVKLLDLLHAISVKTEVPVIIDYYHIEAKSIDIEKLVVSHPSRKTSWSRLLRAVTVPNKMTRQYKIDEAGKPFVWITTPSPRKKER